MVILIKALKFIGCWTSFGDQCRCHQRYSLFGIEVWNITCPFSLPFPQDKTLLDIYCLWTWHHSLSHLCSLRAYLHQAKLGTKAKKSNDKQRKKRQTSKKIFAIAFAWYEWAFSVKMAILFIRQHPECCLFELTTPSCDRNYFIFSGNIFKPLEIWLTNIASPVIVRKPCDLGRKVLKVCLH